MFCLGRLYGTSRQEFKDTIHDLHKNDPEAVYADPNNPLLIQLIAERESRRVGSIKSIQKVNGKRPATVSSSISSRESVSMQTERGSGDVKFIHQPRSIVGGPKLSKPDGSLNGAVRFGLVNSLATQPDPRGGAWGSIPLCALARSEHSIKAKTDLDIRGDSGKAPVPLHGELRNRNEVSIRRRQRRNQVDRDIALVKGLF